MREKVEVVRVEFDRDRFSAAWIGVCGAVKHGLAAGSFAREDHITFGAGANETSLTPETEELFGDLTARLFESRHPSGTVRNPLYRLQPERWLDSELRREIEEIEPGLRGAFVYSQVPAFSAGDRGMLDLLTVSRAGQACRDGTESG